MSLAVRFEPMAYALRKNLGQVVKHDPNDPIKNSTSTKHRHSSCRHYSSSLVEALSRFLQLNVAELRHDRETGVKSMTSVPVRLLPVTTVRNQGVTCGLWDNLPSAIAKEYL